MSDSNKTCEISQVRTLISIIGLLMLLSPALSSCRHHDTAGVHHNPSNIVYSHLLTTLQGTWISYEYVLNLNKTRSPYKSASFMEGIFSFTIDSSRQHHDTIFCTALMNGHEEQGFWIAFDSVDATGRYDVGIARPKSYDGSQVPQPNDNITKLKIDSPYLIIYTNTFDSVRYAYFGRVPKGSSPDYALRQYTTGALFRGEYINKDPGLIFSSDRIYFDTVHLGRISGSPAYDSFDINTDVLSQPDSGDYMEFFDSRNQTESRSYTYKFSKNDLRLFENQESTPCILTKSTKQDTLSRR